MCRYKESLSDKNLYCLRKNGGREEGETNPKSGAATTNNMKKRREEHEASGLNGGPRSVVAVY
jgi:hypothetical protein